MKKSVILIVLATVLFFSSCSSSTGSEEKLIGEIDIGSTKNQVIEQMGYSEDYYDDIEDELYYEDIKIFGQYCKYVSFYFEDNELQSIIIGYTSAAENKTIFNELEKSYGKNEYEAEFDDDTAFYWYHNGARISFAKGNDIAPTHIMIHKNED